MCGIVGYVGFRGACDILINGLRRLEYRGYDSAGIALADADGIRILKDSGKVAHLASRIYGEWNENIRNSATTGIAHTRWATHGAPTAANSHPHTDQSGRIALVHNGIIENHAAIRRQMEGRGHRFVSETDTEALAHLIGELYHGDLFEAVSAALKQVEGTFGIAVLCADTPDRIVVARRGSPLVIGLGENATIVASDVSAVISHTRQVIYLNDGDIAVVTCGGADIRSIHNIPVTREVARVEWDAKAVEKGGFAHFMLKEIHEQPDAIENTLRGRIDHDAGDAVLSGLGLSPREMAVIRRVIAVGCGTSLHSGMVGKYFFEELAGIPADAEQAAEFRYRNPIIGPDDMIVALSQSGETADTLAAAREAMRKGAMVAGICNVVGSTIARETGRGVYLHAGPEIGVASTKAFTCQLVVLLLMALKLARGRRLGRSEGIELCTQIMSLPDLVRQTLAREQEIVAVAGRYAAVANCFFLGRGCLYPVALEGALKLKEISYIHAEGYHAAELKHGPIALLDDKVPVIALLNDMPGKDKMLNNVHECRARGAPVIGVVTEGDDDAAAQVDAVIHVPGASSLIAPIPTAVALQLFAYHVARIRGCPIDQPRNLAKSVTVE